MEIPFFYPPLYSIQGSLLKQPKRAKSSIGLLQSPFQKLSWEIGNRFFHTYRSKLQVHLIKAFGTFHLQDDQVLSPLHGVRNLYTDTSFLVCDCLCAAGPLRLVGFFFCRRRLTCRRFCPCNVLLYAFEHFLKGFLHIYIYICMYTFRLQRPLHKGPPSF